MTKDLGSHYFLNPPLIMKLHTCVRPGGRFVFAIHKPSFKVTNLRREDVVCELGRCGAEPVLNSRNFPDGDLETTACDWVYEIANPFSFKGTTFINAVWADAQAAQPLAISLPAMVPVSMVDTLRHSLAEEDIEAVFPSLPPPVLLALATTSTDPEDLIRLARLAASFTDDSGEVRGLRYEQVNTQCRAIIHNHDLYEAVANNPHLPEDYRQAMVLRPGAQGGSEIIGEFRSGESHVFEYLRRNSYIPWGHYAANMANDAVRYSLADLGLADMVGMRHLYYQRTYERLAADLGLAGFKGRSMATAAELEAVRVRINMALAAGARPSFTATLWGWNYGFDFAASGYRLNASHQMIHQQYALVPAAGLAEGVEAQAGFVCGDLVADFCSRYRLENGTPFFDDYLAAIRANSRMDNGPGEASLIIHEDEHVMVFVPKAQTSQWEVQIMTTGQVGNILELSSEVRHSLDTAFFLAVRALHGIGVKLMCTIEYAKRFTCEDADQRLLYVLLPKLPKSPGAFSESQLRWISGHFPEDLATALRAQLPIR